MSSRCSSTTYFHRSISYIPQYRRTSSHLPGPRSRSRYSCFPSPGIIESPCIISVYYRRIHASSDAMHPATHEPSMIDHILSLNILTKLDRHTLLGVERPRPRNRNVSPKIRLPIHNDRNPVSTPNRLRAIPRLTSQLSPIRTPGTLCLGIHVPHSRETNRGQFLELVSIPSLGYFNYCSHSHIL